LAAVSNSAVRSGCICGDGGLIQMHPILLPSLIFFWATTSFFQGFSIFPGIFINNSLGDLICWVPFAPKNSAIGLAVFQG